MAAQNKTGETVASPTDFIHSFVDNDRKKDDSLRLMELMQQWSGFEPRMWGPSVIGLGRYHYKYAGGHEGDAPLLGFSPRKAGFSLYVTVPGEDNQQLLGQLGKYKMGKACIYFKKLADLNMVIFGLGMSEDEAITGGSHGAADCYCVLASATYQCRPPPFKGNFCSGKRGMCPFKFRFGPYEM